MGKELTLKSSFFLIRNGVSGAWLPIAKQRNKTSTPLSTSLPPRLFSSFGAAKQALSWWIAGEFYHIHYYDPARTSENYGIQKRERAERIIAEMEILEILIRPVSFAEREKLYTSHRKGGQSESHTPGTLDSHSEV